MEFSLKKCGVLELKKWKVVKFEGIDLPEGQNMKTVEDDAYSYLGFLSTMKLHERNSERDETAKHFKAMNMEKETRQQKG